jgi:hypothetical protein
MDCPYDPRSVLKSAYKGFIDGCICCCLAHQTILLIFVLLSILPIRAILRAVVASDVHRHAALDAELCVLRHELIKQHGVLGPSTQGAQHYCLIFFSQRHQHRSPCAALDICC